MSVGLTTKGTIESATTGNLGPLMYRNKLVNANGRINQRRVSGTISLGAGAYGHDQWRAGAAGCTYTVASNGLDLQFTITAGSLVHPVEAGFMPGGKMVLSWEGSSQGRINGGAYGSSGINADCPVNTQAAVEFGTGTFVRPQFEPGTIPTVFERRFEPLEKILCLRYVRFYWGQAPWMMGQTVGTQNAAAVACFDPPLFRAADLSVNGVAATSPGGGSVSASSAVMGLNDPYGLTVNLGWGGAVFSAAQGATIITGSNAASYMAFVAELP